MKKFRSKSKSKHLELVNERVASNKKTLSQLKKEQRRLDDEVVNEMVAAFNEISVGMEGEELVKLKNLKYGK